MSEMRARFVLTIVALLHAGACAGPTSAEPAHHEDEEAPEGHGHGHDGESSGERYDRGLLERLAGRRCEHGVPVLECDECRYEVGAVDVAPALLSGDGDDLVRAMPIEQRAPAVRLALTGEVAFDESLVAHMSPRVEGVAREVHVRLGDRVERDATLVAMDSLELGRLRSDSLRAAARLDLARKNFDREQALHEKRIASGREKLQAETAYREARIELEASEAQLRLLGTGPAGRGGGTAIRAPMAGTVVMLHAVRGERLSPEAPVATIADLSRVWVWASVYERDLEPLLVAARQRTLSAEVEAVAFPDRVFIGAVDSIGAVMEEETRTIKVRVVVDNDDELLRPGMFVKVAMDLGAGPSVPLVPAEAVVEHEGQSFVFIKIGPTRFLRRDVRVRSAGRGLVALQEGVSPGEEVVVRGAFLLKSDILREQMGAGCAD